MWKLEQEEEYFRILDSKKQIAGYFDPDYGDVFPKEKEQEIIENMLKNHDKILGGFLMVGLVKFGIFDGDYNSDIFDLEKQIDSVKTRILQWKELISNDNIKFHSVRISHTDQDMLTITFPVKFSQPTPLDKKEIYAMIEPILSQLQQQHLL